MKAYHAWWRSATACRRSASSPPCLAWSRRWGARPIAGNTRWPDRRGPGRHFLGIFLSYAVVGPVATKIKTVREKKNRLYIIVKQTLLAYMNGALPQVAIEFAARPYRPMSGRPSTPSSRAR